MTFAAEMRLGSLGILIALGGFLIFASRIRARPLEDAAFAPARIDLDVNEGGTVRRVSAPCPVTVGRSREADVPLMDPSVSRLHARFESEDGVVYLTDLQSANGTFLNGRRIDESIEVRAGDYVNVGNAGLVVRGTKKTWT